MRAINNHNQKCTSLSTSAPEVSPSFLTLSHRYRCYQRFICVVQISEISSRVARYNSGLVLNGRPLPNAHDIFFPAMCGFKWKVEARNLERKHVGVTL